MCTLKMQYCKYFQKVLAVLDMRQCIFTFPWDFCMYLGRREEEEKCMKFHMIVEKIIQRIFK